MMYFGKSNMPNCWSSKNKNTNDRMWFAVWNCAVSKIGNDGKLFKGLKTEESRQFESEYLSYEKQIWIIFSRFLLYFEFFDITRYKALVFRYGKQNIYVSSYSVLHLRTWGPGKKNQQMKKCRGKNGFFSRKFLRRCRRFNTVTES